MKGNIHLILFFFAVALTSCQNEGELLKKENFETWPLNIPEGYVRCIGNSAVIFEVNGTIYAVNDAARDMKKYEDINEITLDDPDYPGERVKLSVSRIEFEGLILCY